MPHWDPIRDLMQLQDRMNDLFEDATQRRAKQNEPRDNIERVDWVPVADVYEHAEEYVVAMDLPGPGSVFLSQQWKFTAPVYIGDTITAKAEVMSVHATKPVTQLRIDVTRQTGETVLEGEAWCYTMPPEAHNA